MKFEFEWQEAPGVLDRVLATTWASLRLSVGDQYISESLDLRSDSRRISIDGALFPLSVWLVENWWHLLHEPSPRSPVPAGRAADPSMRSWVQRHNLLAARDGGALPDLTIVRDGEDVLLQWEADPVFQVASRIRFVGQGKLRVRVAEFERSAQTFVEAVLARLEEVLAGNEEVRRVSEAWYVIRTADPEEAALCRSLATMGVDPYDADEANQELIEAVERGLRVLPDELREDLLEGSDASSFVGNLDWVERGRKTLRNGVDGAKIPSVRVAATSPHELGYLTANKVRSELLGLAEDAPVPDLKAALVNHLGWTTDCLRTTSAKGQLEGMVGLDEATSGLVLVTASTQSERALRFRLARAAFFPVSRQLGSGARLLTRSATPSHRASRAFAAELLAPAAALADRVSGSLTEQDLEKLASEFSVNALVIAHQIENHRLGYVNA